MFLGTIKTTCLSQAIRNSGTEGAKRKKWGCLCSRRLFTEGTTTLSVRTQTAVSVTRRLADTFINSQETVCHM